MKLAFQSPEHRRRLYASIHAAMMSASVRHDLIALSNASARATRSSDILDAVTIAVLVKFADAETERIRAIVPTAPISTATKAQMGAVDDIIDAALTVRDRERFEESCGRRLPRAEVDRVLGEIATMIEKVRGA